MTKYRTSPLVGFISFVILFSLSLFLYSCGVSNPTGSSPNSVTTTTVPSSTISQAVQPLMSASYTSTKLTITLSNVNASHTLYMIQDSASKSAATFLEVALPQTINNIYEVSLTPDDAYTFTLVETINNKLVVKESLISVPNFLGKNHRTNLTINNQNGSGNTNTSTNTPNALSQSMMPMRLTTKGSQYQLYVTIPNKFDVIGVYYSVDVMTCFLPDSTGIRVDTGTYTLKNHVWKVDDCADCLGLMWGIINSTPPNEYIPKKGRVSWYMPRVWLDNNTIDSVEFSGSNNPIEIDIGTGYPLTVELVGGPDGLAPKWDRHYVLAATTWSSSDPSVGIVDTSWGIPYFSPRKPGTTTITAVLSGMNGLCSTNSVTFIVGSKKITISPPKATIYVHHTDPTKKQQQFTASDGSQDVTRQVTWSTSDTNIATISNFDIHKGLAFAGTKAGTVTVSAVDSAGTKADPSAQLCVECVEYKHIRQNVPTWMDWPYDGYQRTGIILKSGVLDHSIGAVGCNLTVDNMVLNILGENTDPQQLNEWLTQHGGWINDGPDWDVLKAYSANIKSQIKSVEVEKAYNTDEIDNYLNNCNIIIALVAGQWRLNSQGKWVQSFPHHYVLIIGGRHGDYKIYDPWKHNSTDPTPQEENITTYGQYIKYTAITLN